MTMSTKTIAKTLLVKQLLDFLRLEIASSYVYGLVYIFVPVPPPFILGWVTGFTYYKMYHSNVYKAKDQCLGHLKEWRTWL